MKLIIIVLAAVAFASCNSSAPKVQPAIAATSTTAPAAKPHEITDPVCGMVKDSTWKDYTVYKGDTVWFCSTTEKEAFVANPKRYEKKLAK